MVSIIIVHYKAKRELFECLDSIISSHPKTPFQIIVVDNDEKKNIESDLKKKFSSVKYIPSQKNAGFGAGNNLGAKQAKGEYLFFLNPDTIVKNDAIDNLVRFAENKKNVGMIAPLLLDAYGNPYPLQGTQKLTPRRAVVVYSFINKLWPNNPVSRKFWLKNWNKKKEIEADVIPGTAFLISKSVFDKAGGFDEKFFLFFEEYDLADKVNKLRLKSYIFPDAKVVHFWGRSTENSSENIQQIFDESRFYYFRKHYGLLSALLVRFVTSFNKSNLLFVLVFAMGIFLRFLPRSAKLCFWWRNRR